MAAGLVVVCALSTFWAGASEHLPAFVLRLGALLWAASLKPASPVRASPAPAPSMWLPLGCLVPIVWGLARAPEPGWAVQSVVSALAVVGLFYALTRAPVAAARDAWGCASAVMAVHAAYACAQALHFLGPLVDRGPGGFYNPNDLGAALAPYVVAAAGALCWQPAGAALLGLGVLASGSRAAGLAVAAALLINALGRRHHSGAPRAGVRARLGAALGALGLAALFMLRLRFADPLRSSRWQIWRRCVEVALAHPAGVGLGSFATALRTAGVAMAGPVRFPYVANHAHNEVLHAWVELGYAGLLAALLPALWAAAQIAQLARRGAGAAAARHAGMWLAFAIPACCSNTLHLPPIALSAAIWAAWLQHEASSGMSVAAAASPDRAAVELPPAWRQRCAAYGLALATLLPALPGASADLGRRLSEHYEAAGNLWAAGDWARWAAAQTPWSVGLALRALGLAHRLGRPLPDTLADLQALAAQAPQDSRPPARAAALWEALPPPASQARACRRAQAWEAAAAADPHNALFWVEAGRAYDDGGQASRAVCAWEKALQREPLCAAALWALAEHDDDVEVARRRRALARRAAAQAPRYRGYAAAVLTLPDTAQPSPRPAPRLAHDGAG